jgi:hypothetical protein
MWAEHRAHAQAWRSQAEAAGDDTAELDQLIAELDQEIANDMREALSGFGKGL